MSQQLAKQQRKVFTIQFFTGMTIFAVGTVIDLDAMPAFAYSLLIGGVYALILSISATLSDRVSDTDPKLGMVILYAGAVIRFISVGVLLAIGIKNWPQLPFAIVLPFIAMLMAPIFLLVTKKRLTD